MGNDKDWIFGADASYYKGLSSSSAIKCRDGSKKFNKSQFNDDFCDCPDGSDEPGYSLTLLLSSVSTTLSSSSLVFVCIDEL